ncbi:MAG: translocation/assembly module TamB domain-containing protein [Candidatus Electryonea clarkiae]|nr:translocation/assembly module TamB domain-containing protein [Candidatus Electryonea clarkiae]MDP8287944.1 translocation/assembly module TamB domain-containing protein [Candidatus Electryonea clarkiae]
MRRRPFVLVLAVFLLALAFCLFILLRYINRSHFIKNKIVEITENISGTLQISNANLYPTTLRLKQLTYFTADSSIEISIEELRLNIRVQNLIKQKDGGIERIISGASLINPTFIIHQIPGVMDDDEDNNILIKPETFRFVEHFDVKGGEVIYLADDEDSWLRITSLNGWVNSIDQQDVNFSFSADLYDDTSSSLNIDGTADFLSSNFLCNLSLDQFDFQNAELPDNSPVKLLGGNIRLVSQLNYDTTGTRINGEWNVSDCAIEIFDKIHVDHLYLSSKITENQIYFEGDLNIQDDSAKLSGSFPIVKDPVLEARLEIPRGRLGMHLKNFRALKSEKSILGIVHAYTLFKWKPAKRDWNFRARVVSDSLRIKIGPLRDVNTNMHWDRRKSRLVFDSATATYFGIDVSGDGDYQPYDNHLIDMDLVVSGMFDPEGLPAWTEPLRNKQIKTHFDVFAQRGEGYKFDGTGSVRSDNDPAVGEISGYFSSQGYEARIDLYSPYRRNSSAEIKSVMKKPPRMSTSEPHILAEWWDSSFGDMSLLDKFNTYSEFDYRSNVLKSATTVFYPKGNIEFKIYGSTELESENRYNGKFSYTLTKDNDFIGNGDLGISYFKQDLSINQFSFNDYLFASGAINFQKKEFENLTVIIEELDIGDLVERATELSASDVSGLINGRANINGSLENPVVEANFEMSNGRYKDLQQYWGILSLSTNITGDLVIDAGKFGRAETILLKLDGEYNIPSDSLNILIESTGSDANILAEAFTGRTNLVEGLITLTGRVTGGLGLPAWNGNVELTDAKISGIEFDNVDIQIDGITTKRLGHVLYLRRFDMQKTDEYQLTINGAIPLNKSAGLVEINMEGNVLQLLPQLSDYVISAKGKGKISSTWLVIAGQKIAIGETQMNIIDGDLKFTDFIPDLEDFQVDISVNDDGYLNINQFSGEIGKNGTFEIQNVQPNSSDSVVAYFPVILQPIELNMGVLKFRTVEEDGIPIRIPDLMTTSEYARIRLGGSDRSEISSSSASIAETIAEVLEFNREDNTPDLPDTNAVDDNAWFQVSGPSPGHSFVYNRSIINDLNGTPSESSGLDIDNGGNGKLVAVEAEIPGIGLDSLLIGSRTQSTESSATLIPIPEMRGDGLKLQGSIEVSNARITYPPKEKDEIAEKKENYFKQLIETAEWDVETVIGRDVWYVYDIEGFENAPLVNQFKGFLDRISIETTISPSEQTGTILLSGRIADETFRMLGELVSNRGSIDFLDQSFQVEQANIIFDNSDILPVVSGRAAVDVVDPETGFTRIVYLTLYVIDPVTGQRNTRGRWGDFILILEGDPGTSVEGEMSQEEILSLMGYSAEGLTGKFGSIGGSVINRVSRRLLRPIERDVERWLRLDLVRLNPAISTSWMGLDDSAADTLPPVQQTGLAGKYLPGSTFTVGKYITTEIYISYTGQLANEVMLEGVASQGRIGLLQTWNFTYRINRLSPNLVFDAGWEYDNLEKLDNRSAKLRYTFTF